MVLVFVIVLAVPLRITLLVAPHILVGFFTYRCRFLRRPFDDLVQQEFRMFLVKKADYSKQYSILALDFL